MAVKFNPQAKVESAVAREVLPEGTYRFKVASAKQKTSQSGNPMVETNLIVHNKSNSGTTRDWLGAWLYGDQKIISFLDSIGLPTDKGELHVNQVVGRSGYLKLVVKDSTNPKFPGKVNNVARYLTVADLVAEGILRAGTPPPENPPVPPPAVPESDDPPPLAAVVDDDLNLPF
jgi:hypothetical protein